LREHSTTGVRLKGGWAREAKQASGFVAPAGGSGNHLHAQQETTIPRPSTLELTHQRRRALAVTVEEASLT
jgi:hypothetical protein